MLTLNKEQQAALVARIAVHLHEHCSEKYSEGHRHHLGASLIGDSCSRKLWYSFRWVLTPSYVDAKGKDQRGRMMRLFNRGHTEEFRFVEWLRGMGFRVQEFDDAAGLDAKGKRQQFRIKGVFGHFGGSLDGMVDFPPEYGDVPTMLLEFKTSGHKYFDKLKTEGVKFAKPQHYAQMSVYGEKYQLRYALYMCVNKDTDEIYPEIVELDWALAQKLETKAGEVIMSAGPLNKLSENSAYFECKFCNFAPVCHGQVAYEKNCRSCKFSAPVEDGQWKCHYYGIIPKEFQPKGCSLWETIPR